MNRSTVHVSHRNLLEHTATTQQRHTRSATAKSCFRGVVMAAGLAGGGAFLAGPLLGLATVARAQVAHAAPSAPHMLTVAHAFEEAVRVHDATSLMGPLAPEAQIKEKHAVLAAGAERVQAWVQDCVTTGVTLETGSLSVIGNTVRWQFQDRSGCYERTRPNAVAPGWNVMPADGTLELHVQDQQVVALTFTYSPDWERKRLTAQAAPIRTAQAQATVHAHQGQVAATATAAQWAEATRVAEASRPHPPDPQERATPSLVPWIAALLVTIGMTGIASFGSKPVA
ncbi:MAG TPA: hypothetical protein VGW38_17010 [Chloroflexota bacterium]|nr:hypothetical protein [Chloroflexota bacterium]